jgi:hypothetical protein
MVHFGLFANAKTSKVNNLMKLWVLALLQTSSAVNSDKVSFQIFEIDSPLSDIMWCGNTNEVILVQSEMGTIYRSRDRGDSWKKLHSMMHQTGMSVIDEGQTVSKHFYSMASFQDIGKVKKMMQSPVDDNLVVFTGKSNAFHFFKRLFLKLLIKDAAIIEYKPTIKRFFNELI